MGCCGGRRSLGHTGTLAASNAGEPAMPVIKWKFQGLDGAVRTFDSEQEAMDHVAKGNPGSLTPVRQ